MLKLSLKVPIILLLLLLGQVGFAFAAGITIPLGSSLNINSGTLNVSGDITNAGTLQVSTGTITLTGNWSNTGTFTAGTGTVTLNGTNQTISGSATFYNLTKNVSLAYTLTFANTTTQTVTNSLNLQGLPNRLLSLRSNSAGVQFRIILQSGGSQALSFLDVKDSDASGGVTLIGGVTSVDSGNNINWNFAGESGGGFGFSLFSFDSLGRPKVGTSNLSANGTVVLRCGSHTVTITVNRVTGEVTME